MNKAQKTIMTFWLLFAGTIIVTIILEISSLESKGIFITIAWIPILIIAPLTQDFSHYTGYGYGRNNRPLGNFIKDKPILKIWLVIFCTFILPIIIYKMMTDDEADGFLYWLSLALLVGPIFVASEYERFLDATEK